MKSQPKSRLFAVSLALVSLTCIVSLAAPENSSPRSADKSPATPVASLKTLSGEEAFKPLDELNRKGQLLTTQFPGQTFTYSGLRPENCFGLVLANGARVVGQSDGRVGGEGDIDKEKVASIGFLWTDTPLLVEGKELGKGSFILFASESNLRFCEHPMPFGLAIPLKSKLDFDALKAGRKQPLFSFVQENGEAYLQLGSNRLLIKAQ